MKSGASEARGAADGQVLIEVLLILPVFMLLVFFIMQIGFFSFQAIVTHHGAYEIARIASLTATKGSPCWKVEKSYVEKTAKQMFTDQPSVHAVEEPTLPNPDPQEGNPHCDVVVTLERKVKISLPMISLLMRTATKGSCDATGCTITAVVRMPIERPLTK